MINEMHEWGIKHLNFNQERWINNSPKLDLFLSKYCCQSLSKIRDKVINLKIKTARNKKQSFSLFPRKLNIL